MAKIRELFDPTRDLNRPIEKVITYQARTDAQLLTEINEYVATEHIEESFRELLGKMQAAHSGGAGHEVGVWVSGFYGSGKSSFTKYLGFALDRQMQVSGKPFLQHLQRQLKDKTTQAQLNAVAATYDAAVVFLDLASEMLAGSAMEDVSTVLYLKVLQWAGYSEDIKVAELERKLEVDGRLNDFLKRAKQELDGADWAEARNQPLVANQIAARLAGEFYPKLFPKPEEFLNLTLHVKKTELTRVAEMIELVRKRSGKKNIIFIVDEVGQYVSAKQELILNLDGLAKNIKQVGGGTVWLFATAQQTLTEDNEAAMFNAAGLFKLKDRFPIQIHLEASDIREICHRRLLTKSAKGEETLGKLFDSYGASLRTATQLSNAGVYEVALEKVTFINLYPFLPAHFEILLQLLGRLARKTGGLGLRSAIKVLQEVLIERASPDTKETLADAPVGSLANTVTFYNALQKDIQSTFSHVVAGVERVTERFPKEKFYHEVAKSIAVLQILENLPVTAGNVAALLQANVTDASKKEQVEQAVDALLKDGLIPIGEKNGSLRFLTQAAATLQKQFDEIECRNHDLRAELNGAIRTLFEPLPTARIFGSRTVTAGVRIATPGMSPTALAGEKEPIQYHVGFCSAADYERVKQERVDDSRASGARTTLHWIARTDGEALQLATTLVRCRRFLDQHRSAPDPETQEFAKIIDERGRRAAQDLNRRLTNALLAGSHVAHGQSKAVAESGADLEGAAKQYLADAATRVFDRYSEAPVQVDGALAEKFLKTPLDKIASADDPLGLVVRPGGQPRIKLDHKALVSIRDFLNAQGQVEGRRLLDHFAEPPFGWSKDTTRYLLAAAFVGCDIKMRISGTDHLTKSDESLGAFVSNKAFGAAGVSLREEKPDPEALMRACARLAKLTGESLLPLEDIIATAAKKHFPAFQAKFSPLGAELRSLSLGGKGHAERADNLRADLAEVVSGDGSDAVKRLGGVESPLNDALTWAADLQRALEKGLRDDLAHLADLRSEIRALPTSGLPAKLARACEKTLADVDDLLARDAFFKEFASIRTAIGEMDKAVVATVAEIAEHHAALSKGELKRWESWPQWSTLSPEDRAWFSAEAAALVTTAEPNLLGLKTLISHEYSLHNRFLELAETLRGKAPAPVVSKDPADEPDTAASEVQVMVPTEFRSAAEIDLIIAELTRLKAKLATSPVLKLIWKVLS